MPECIEKYTIMNSSNTKILPHPVMFVGTGSDVGKSIIATAFCRIFKQDGYRPAPYKAQNMALNSYVTPDGLEIGRAQAVQAEAAGIACTAEMNPVLLKPNSDHTSQVVLNGKPIGNRAAYDYFRNDIRGREELRAAAKAAYDRLSSLYNPIVLEGAGSISELNLADTDIVNMSMAVYTHACTILIADIDRGGVFASVYGSIMLLSPEQKKRIKGIIINKFRGDLRLFEEGRKILEKITGIPVLGVVPVFKDIHIEEEDSVALSLKSTTARDSLINIAVVRHPQLSNYTDFNSLERDDRVNVYYTYSPEELGKADIIILPGTKSTLSDLRDLHNSGLAETIVRSHRAGKTVLGICGGYQMMGIEVRDPEHVEGALNHVPGLGLLPVITEMSGEKITRRTDFTFLPAKQKCFGYEIHMGRSFLADGAEARVLNKTLDGKEDGYYTNVQTMGTYMHGILDNPEFVEYILSPYLKTEEKNRERQALSYHEYKDKQYDLLAEHVRKYVDVEKLYELMKQDD